MRPKLPPLVVGKRSHPGKIHFYVGPSCAMAEEMKGRVIGGEGKEAEVDGGYFGGYGKPANLKEDRIVRSAAAIRSLQCSTRKVRPPHLSAPVLQRARSFTPTKQRLGIIFMSVSNGAVFFLLMLGVVGLPIPDETLMVFCGYLIS